MATLQKIIVGRIRALRHSSKWTQEDLGARAGLDFTTIGGAERGEKSLSLNSLARVADALAVDLAWLVRPEVSKSGAAENEELIEELLSEVSDLKPPQLRHVLDLVRVVRSYMNVANNN